MDKDEFINLVVLGWIKEDLTRMRLSILPDSSAKGNIHFPLALCALAYMESLGGYLLGSDQKFAKNVQTYIDTCFINPSEYPVVILKDLLRNGLAHDYFPRVAISRNGVRPPVYRGNTYDVVLDAETLVIDFIESLEKFIIKLSNEHYESRKLEAENAMNEFMRQHKHLIDKLPVQPGDNLNTKPSTGPSGPFGPIN